MANTNISTLGFIANRVSCMSKNYLDEMVPTADITFDNLDTMRIAAEPHSLRNMAQRGICYRLGIPHQYLKKCPPEVQAENLNYWITKERNEQLFVRFDGQDVRVLFSPRYKPIDHTQVIERLFSMGYKDNNRLQCYLDNNFMSLSLFDEGGSFKLMGHDSMMPGITVGNSEVGVAALSLAFFVMRMVCSNGMVSKTSVAASYRHVRTGIMNEFPAIIDRLSSELSVQKDQFKISLKTHVDNPVNTIETLAHEFNLSPQERKALDWAKQYELGDTMFHVVQVFTKASQDNELSASSAYRILSMVKPSEQLAA